jgi:hypothetical protein
MNLNLKDNSVSTFGIWTLVGWTGDDCRGHSRNVTEIRQITLLISFLVKQLHFIIFYWILHCHFIDVFSVD